MFDVKTKQVDAQPYVSRSQRMRVGELSPFIRDTIHELMAEHEPAGPPFAIFQMRAAGGDKCQSVTHRAAPGASRRPDPVSALVLRCDHAVSRQHLRPPVTQSFRSAAGRVPSACWCSLVAIVSSS
jgi:hypothetical protein